MLHLFCRLCRLQHQVQEGLEERLTEGGALADVQQGGFEQLFKKQRNQGLVFPEVEHRADVLGQDLVGAQSRELNSRRRAVQQGEPLVMGEFVVAHPAVIDYQVPPAHGIPAVGDFILSAALQDVDELHKIRMGVSDPGIVHVLFLQLSRVQQEWVPQKGFVCPLGLGKVNLH